MAVIIPFPASRACGATRALRIFRAQAELEKTRRQATLFFAASALVVAFLITGLELLARIV
jgi:hypothetical protein